MAQEQLKKKKEYWRKVFLRIIAIVKYIAKHNLAFRETNEKLHQNRNGNFLGLIEMSVEFDLVIEEHIRCINDGDIHHHHLGHNIQNELILLIASAIKK